MKRSFLFFLFLCAAAVSLYAQVLNEGLAPLITNIPNRQVHALDGRWHYIIDPYETGYLDYRHKPMKNGFFKDHRASDPSELVEYNFSTSPTLAVPGDWNTQSDELLYYEGTIWYERKFHYQKKPGKRVFLYFGAVNYEAKVWLNGEYLGMHTGGFTPFNFEVTGKLKANNSIVIKADNSRRPDGVPTDNSDWWNYGGVTRSVLLVETPPVFIRDYFIHLKNTETGEIGGWVQLDGNRGSQEVQLGIPELNKEINIKTDPGGYGVFSFREKHLKLWDPEDPKLYDIAFRSPGDTLEDQVGFRTIAVKGQNILLNGKPVFLRGVSIHEEAPFGGGRIRNKAQDQTLLRWAKALNCNFVRLAHYPHNESMVREAERTGLLVWSEIPVYWTIHWSDSMVLQNAVHQLHEEITRDKNRANIILWSIGNETPKTGSRLKFMAKLAAEARALDSSRLVTAALQPEHLKNGVSLLNDPLGKYLDVLGCNTYPGWYSAMPKGGKQFRTTYDKPLIMSEFGAGALQGLHGNQNMRWSEEFQNRVYKDDITMLKQISFLRGTTPWILKDFRSPKRVLPGVQDGWNLKGLISDQGIKKQAFYTMRSFYKKIKNGMIKFGNREK